MVPSAATSRVDSLKLDGKYRRKKVDEMFKKMNERMAHQQSFVSALAGGSAASFRGSRAGHKEAKVLSSRDQLAVEKPNSVAARLETHISEGADLEREGAQSPQRLET